jgi:DNA-3-methyladenine glycosylase
VEKDWASGPGRVCAALGIGLHHYGADLAGEEIWLEDRGVRVPKVRVATGPRVGIDYAGDWIHVPWRFIWKAA